MSLKKVVVFCPRGRQGESVVKYLAKDPQYEIHCVTRYPDHLKQPEETMDKTAAQDFDAGVGGRKDRHEALARLNTLGDRVKIVGGDVDDKESVGKVLEGAFACWWNASWWATLGACQGDWDKACDEVFKQGKGIIDACLKAEVEIFSLGLHSQTFTCVDHPEIDGYFRCCRWLYDYAVSLKASHTMVWSAAWFDNFLPSAMCQLAKDPESEMWSLLPPLPASTRNIHFAVEQNGAFVKAAFDDPSKWAGKGMHVASEDLTYGETLPAEIERITGKKLRRWDLTDEAWASAENRERLGPLWALMDEMYRRYEGFNYAKYNVPLKPREIVPELWSVEDWARNTPAFQEYLGFSM